MNANGNNVPKKNKGKKKFVPLGDSKASTPGTASNPMPPPANPQQPHPNKTPAVPNGNAAVPTKTAPPEEEGEEDNNDTTTSEFIPESKSKLD